MSKALHEPTAFDSSGDHSPQKDENKLINPFRLRWTKSCIELILLTRYREHETYIEMQRTWYIKPDAYKLGWAELNQAEKVRLQLYAKLYFQV